MADPEVVRREAVERAVAGMGYSGPTGIDVARRVIDASGLVERLAEAEALLDDAGMVRARQWRRRYDAYRARWHPEAVTTKETP